jgi:uncharacterized membrane protein
MPKGKPSVLLAAVSLAALLSLSACGGDGHPGGSPPAATIPAKLRALGTEPFWNVEVDGTRVSYTTPDVPARAVSQVARSDAGGAARFDGRLDGAAFRLVVKPGSCSDGMSDRTYPFAAEVLVGDKTLRGCAQPQ